jgi:LDH2 family malate/lactate/ureidoglycolate dehydrogenase
MVTKTAEDLRALVNQILLAAGASERNAGGVADHLVAANLAGVDTHGIHHLGGYVKHINDGVLVPTADPEVVKEGPTSALLRGHWGFGHVTARDAMEVAINKAEEHGVAVAAIVETTHIGRLGYYVEMAAARQMIGMVWAGGYGAEEPVAVPYGGRSAVLSTNPISIGFPAAKDSPMMFDYATTAIAGTKIDLARSRGQQLPPNSAVDKNGNPTTDTAEYFDGGAHLPFGSHKGYGIMMAAEFFGRILAGSDDYSETERGGPIMRHQGVSLLAIRGDLFQPFEEYTSRAEQMQERVRAVPPAPGFKSVLVPGDMESTARAARRRDGIPILDDVWERLVETANSVGVTV